MDFCDSEVLIKRGISLILKIEIYYILEASNYEASGQTW